VGQIRGRPFEVTWREEDTAAALKAAYQAERTPAVRTRLHALWLLRRGWRLEPVAEAVGTHYRSVQRWVGWYRAGGVAAVRAHRLGGTGQAPFLDEVAQAQVGAEVATGRFRTAAQIRDWIAERYGVSYTLGGIYSLLTRLRCGPKVPRPVHAKADPAAQAAWRRGGSSKRSLRRA
jgi:transposase